MGIVAKYKYDGSVYADLIPAFNAEFTDYTITDEVDSENSNHIIRTIESDSLPTLMRFGQSYVEGEVVEDRSLSLLEILDLNISELTTGSQMFRHCENLININCDWSSNKLLNVNGMFYGCKNIVSLNLSNLVNSNHTNLQQMFQNCLKLETISIDGWNTTNVLNIIGLFQYCVSLKSLDLHEFNALNLSKINNLFNGCSLLKTIDISNFGFADDCASDYIFSNSPLIKYIKCNIPNTISKISSQLPTRTSDDTGTIIYQGTETLPSEVITELQAKGWNVVTSPQLIAKYKYDSKIYKNTIPVFNDGYMGFVEDEEVDGNGVVTRKIEHVELPTLMKFGDTAKTPRSSSLLTIEHLNTSECTTLEYLCAWCNNLSEFNCNLDTSKVKGAYSCFHACSNLSTLNVTSWDTTNFIGYGAYGIFAYCEKLSELDLSNWILDNCNVFARLFEDNKSLTRLDISNLNLNKATNITSMFGGNINNLTDIGMIYCDQSTINKVASLLPTDHNITIWVESDDILQYDQYDHITYKTQKVQDTVHLNSPLLMGDTIEVIDGKTYHVHRCEKVVLDGSEDYNIYLGTTNGGWTEYSDTKVFYYSYSAFPNVAPYESLFCDRLLYVNELSTVNGRGISNITWGGDQNSTGQNGHIAFRLMNNELSDFTKEGFKQWLSENPTTVIYKLKTPYYELISEEPLELTLLDTTDNTINNNSILPSNMTIANKELSTIAIKPSTTYTLSFDKSIEDSEVTIDICGGEQITTVLNRIELTTPSELGSGIRFISSDGCIVSNVRLLEGSLVEKAIPKETFEGLKSSFEDGYLIGDNIIGELYNLHDWKEVRNNYVANTTKNTIRQSNLFISLPKKLKNNQQYTVFVKMTDYTQGLCFVSLRNNDNTALLSAEYNIGSVGMHSLLFTTTGEASGIRFLTEAQKDNSYAINKDIIILEGDHTHLSEAELMRYIEKGTSHYDEEDYNHVGKYKVQYKVTGKNKNHTNYSNDLKLITNKTFESQLEWDLIPGKTYTISFNYYFTDVDGSRLTWALLYDSAYDYSARQVFVNTGGINNSNSYACYTFTPEYSKVYFICGVVSSAEYWNIQLEEGTVATEYEPYKEDIKTYYLSSPLLEGDTIEDINGVATHVKRRGKVVLNGSEDWRIYVTNSNSQTDPNLLVYRVDLVLKDKGWGYTQSLSNTLNTYTEMENAYWKIKKCLSLGGESILICCEYQSLDKFKQWLSENPTTIVYELASPIYEPISTESILCDSYVNGHLDFDTHIPAEKVVFNPTTLLYKYLQPNTRYIIQFESDNIGKLDNIRVGTWTPQIGITNINKGINKLTFISPQTIEYHYIDIRGIGFNASNIQVVETNEDIEFDYFKGLQSSFESELVTDENDENYGKYKVECKIVGKNKFDGLLESGDININTGALKAEVSCIRTVNYIDVRNMDKITLTRFDHTYTTSFRLYDSSYNYIGNASGLGSANTVTIDVSNVSYIKFRVITSDTTVKYQLEEGTKATPYEPYKESIHTLYLNSPLLKGDKLVVHDGKLCHYHKMGMVVLDGSKDEYWSKAGIYIPFVVIRNVGLKPNGNMGHDSTKGKMHTNILQPNIITSTAETDNRKGIYVVGSGEYNEIRIRLTDNDTVNSVKQWLQQNPTTVVYELAEPYYEPIEPQLSQYSFSTVKDGDMDIITALPIEKINLTYRTDINGVSSIEEQIASIQEGTDISSIIDEEVDE